MFNLNLFKPKADKVLIDDLYEKIVLQSRLPAFYQDLAVEDSFEGRFELLTLHAFVVMSAFKKKSKDMETLMQMLFDKIFTEVDRAYREAGVGDLSVGKKVKKLMEEFYGRVLRYETALLSGDGVQLSEALKTNLYGSKSIPEDAISRVSGYFKGLWQDLNEFSRCNLPLNSLSFKSLSS